MLCSFLNYPQYQALTLAVVDVHALQYYQDSGLIFLSHMATDVAAKVIMDGKSAEEAVATGLAVTTLSTLSLGLALILVGKIRLARLMSYLPMPVVSNGLCVDSRYCLILLASSA